MQYLTTSKSECSDKTAPILCIRNDKFTDIEIKGVCFLLVFVSEGNIEFEVNKKTYNATAPCFLCFDETQNPVFSQKSKYYAYSIYFNPKFLNVNMTYSMLRSQNYLGLANQHDMFLLRPFILNQYIVPVTEDFSEKIINCFDGAIQSLTTQVDWYWSCRGRSYFMEMIIILEKMYGLIGRGVIGGGNEISAIIKNDKLKRAILYIESHYSGEITLKDIVKQSGSNHTTIIELFQAELHTTPMVYLWKYRISVAKKQVEFTEIPFKDISTRCGFKTVQHFNRIFKKYTGETPLKYRKSSLIRRKADFMNCAM